MKLCECGCGKPAPLAPQNHRAKGWRKGEPLRFIAGHNPPTFVPPPSFGTSHPGWRGDAASYNAIHRWVQRNHPKSGACSECGTAGRTHWAFLHHPQHPTRDITDYRELCVACHRRFDHGLITLRDTSK
jgi:hypothetical protein